MVNDETQRNIEKVLSEGSFQDRLPLKSKIWTKLNPIYEAMAAAFVRYIDDETIAQRLLKAKDTDEMGELLGIQALMKREELEKIDLVRERLVKGESIQQIVYFAALQLAEDKRTQNGKILYSAAKTQNNLRRYTLKALKKINAEDIYINSNRIPELERRARRIRKRRIAKIVASCLLVPFIAFGSFYGIKKHKEVKNYIKEKISFFENDIEDKKNFLSSLEEKTRIIQQECSEYEQNLSELEKNIKDKEEESENLERENELKKQEIANYQEETEHFKEIYEKSEKDYSDLEGKLAKRRQEFSALEENYQERRKEFSDLENQLKEKARYLSELENCRIELEDIKTNFTELEDDAKEQKVNLTQSRIDYFNRQYQRGIDLVKQGKFEEAESLISSLKKQVEECQRGYTK